MEYSRFIPNIALQPLVECYWIVEGTDVTVQKIIPDGCTELVFHFGRPYKISSDGVNSHVQPGSIAAGQLNRPIYLTPTGESGVLGIKFHAAGIWKMFGCDMHLLTNETFDLADVLGKDINCLHSQVCELSSNRERIRAVETYLLKEISRAGSSADLDMLVGEIQSKKGQLSIDKLSRDHKLSPRKLERIFRQQIGISAKLYSRITRFSNVYQLLQQETISTTDAVYLAGYFDQPHFNREFREFTGENPDSYFKNNHSFSNFFLNR
jgi:AraC-like DNA-binding protein